MPPPRQADEEAHAKAARESRAKAIKELLKDEDPFPSPEREDDPERWKLWEAFEIAADTCRAFLRYQRDRVEDPEGFGLTRNEIDDALKLGEGLYQEFRRGHVPLETVFIEVMAVARNPNRKTGPDPDSGENRLLVEVQFTLARHLGSRSLGLADKVTALGMAVAKHCQKHDDERYEQVRSLIAEHLLREQADEFRELGRDDSLDGLVAQAESHLESAGDGKLVFEVPFDERDGKYSGRRVETQRLNKKPPADP